MTPEKPIPTPHPFLSLIVSYVMSLALVTPVVAIGWNLGLHGAGIAEDTIDWSTALGLAFVVVILRMIAAGARPATTFSIR